MPHDVFVSHSAKDKKVADAVVATFERHRIRCWVAPRDIDPGAQWAASILKAIAECRMMVVIFSSHTNASPHIRREVERAVSRGLPVAPIRIEDVLPSDDLEYFLSSSHWLDATTPPFDKHLEDLAIRVQALLGIDTQNKPAAAVLAPAPARTATHLPEHTIRPAKRRRGLMAALLIGAVAIGVFVLIDRVGISRAKPPSRVQRFDDYMGWQTEHRAAQELILDRESFLLMSGPRARLLASGPPMYVFDSSGRMADWTVDSGNDPRFQSKWLNRGELHLLTSEEARRYFATTRPAWWERE